MLLPQSINGRSNFYKGPRTCKVSSPWTFAKTTTPIHILPQCTEVRFSSLLSDGFTTMTVTNPPDWKLANRTFVHWWRSLYLSMQSGSDIVRHSEITSKWRFSFSSLETPENWSEHALMYFKAYLRVLIISFQELSIYPFCEHPANSNLKIKTKNVNWL